MVQLKIVYSERSDGNMSIAYGEKREVIARKTAFFKKNNIEIERTVCLKVNNQDQIVEVDRQILTKEKNENEVISLPCDGAITREPNLFLYLNFGDCVPFVIFDERQGIMGFAHLGWRSIDVSLQTKMVAYLKTRYHSNPADLKIWLGPAIAPESYRLENISQLQNPLWKPFIEPIDDIFQVDLKGRVIRDIVEQGIPEENITNIAVDTGKENSYFSHYRANKYGEAEGRFLFGAMLVEDIR